MRARGVLGRDPIKAVTARRGSAISQAQNDNWARALETLRGDES
jgi:hypothetical protein